MQTSVWTNEKLFRLYSWVLLRASWKGKEVFPTKNKVQIHPGQFIISYRHAAEELEVSVGTLKDYLDILISERIIERTATNKYTILTVLKWNWLQDTERKSERRLNTDRTQTEPINTLNTLKTERDTSYEQEKDTKLENHLSYLLSIPSLDLLELSNKYAAGQEQIRQKADELHNYCKAHGKVYKDYRAFLSNALKRDYGLRSSLSTFPERPGFVDAKTLKYH